MRLVGIARKRGSWASVVVALAVAALLAGCGGGGGGTPPLSDTTPPTVAVKTNTGIVSATGGPVAIEADASDASGISRIELRITAPSGQTSTAPMTLKSGIRYSATYSAPANSHTTSMIYKFSVYAWDGAGNSASDGEHRFEVLSAEAPPPPPPF